MKQATAESPRLVFGAMLAYYRSHAGMSPEQLGARVFLSGSQIRKIEAGTRTPTEELARACEGIAELGCNGALTELYDILSEHLKSRVTRAGSPAGRTRKPRHAGSARSSRW